LTRAVYGLARANQTTLFMTLFAMFGGVLRHFGGPDDLVIGTDVAGRDVPGTERMVGFFINELALRLDLSGDPTFAALLGRTRNVVLDAFGHQATPFDLVVSAVNPPRDAFVPPLFQVKLVLQNLPAQTPRLSSLAVRPIEPGLATGGLDFVLNAADRGEELRGLWEYNATLFDRAWVRRFARLFRELAACITAHPELRLSELSGLLRAAGRNAEDEELARLDAASSSLLRRISRKESE
jgi:non-ribosomal peptide synthetase component F